MFSFSAPWALASSWENSEKLVEHIEIVGTPSFSSLIASKITQLEH
jgi:hypothetical protein